MISPLVELLDHHAGVRADQPAILQGSEVLTYRQLQERSRSCQTALGRWGVRPGDRVLLFVPPSPDLYALLLGCWRAGAVAVFVDAWATRGRLSQVVDLAAPSLFLGIARSHLLRLLDRRLLSVPARWWWSGRKLPREPTPPRPVDPRSAALITFTTGTTGQPKGASRSHEFLLEQHRALQRTLGTPAGSLDLATLPIFALHDLAAGATCRIASVDPRRPDRIDSERFRQELASADSSAGSPAAYLALAKSDPRPQVQVRARIHIGGARITPQDVRTLRRSFPNASFCAVYGSTEAEPIAHLEGEALESADAASAAGLPVGQPDPALEVAVLRCHDGPIEASSDQQLDTWRVRNGEVGEICVRGSHVLGEYWNDPSAQARHKIRTREGTWHRTGDAGRLDEKGAIHLLGRVADRINREGRDHFPFPLEAMLEEVPGVARGCVLEVDGSVLAAYEATPGATVDEAAIARLPWPLPVTPVRTRLPRDPRHRSRVDTGRLRERLSQARPPHQDLHR